MPTPGSSLSFTHSMNARRNFDPTGNSKLSLFPSISASPTFTTNNAQLSHLILSQSSSISHISYNSPLPLIPNSLQFNLARMSLQNILDDHFWGDDSSFIEQQLAIAVSIIQLINPLAHLKTPILPTIHSFGNHLTCSSFEVRAAVEQDWCEPHHRRANSTIVLGRT